MSEENVELVRQLGEAWNSGGTDAILRFCPEDAIWYPFPDAPFSRDGLRGHDGIREVMAGWIESFADFAVTTDEVRDLGETVVALGEISGTLRGSDISVRQPMGSIFSDFRRGMIGKARFFPSWEATLEAAGLSE
jgi:ketosteroid isomerase-like protein